MMHLFINLMAGGEGGAGGGLGSFLPIILVMVVFYFFMIRPQMRKSKNQKKFREAIGKGDKIVTIGGLHGKITHVDDTTFLIELHDKTTVRIEKSAISMETTMALADGGGQNAKDGGSKKKEEEQNTTAAN